MSEHPIVSLKARPHGAAIFRKMVARPARPIEAGSVVRIMGRDGAFVGQGFYNPRSEIALRVLSRRESPPLDEEWFREQARQAVALRRDILRLGATGDAWRVVHAEGDRLPGLVVDRYADVLSCQVSSLGMYRVFPAIRDELRQLLRSRVVHVSADPRIAKREGFPMPDGAGDAARTTIEEHGLSFRVDCARGHKTGFFLDQRDARLGLRRLATGRRVLDLFGYTGGFALNAARGGAERVRSVDLDEDAVAAGRHNAELNGLASAVEFEHADAFDVLRALRGGEFDVIVVDPAKQTRSRGDLGRALRYYEDLNRLAFEKAAEGALVLTCSCTGVVSEGDFLEALTAAAEGARRQVHFLEIGGAPPDHPLAADFPAGRYLKRVLALVR